MHSITNLFDPRGGLLEAHRCEVCNEPVEEGSTCPGACSIEDYQDDEPMDEVSVQEISEEDL